MGAPQLNSTNENQELLKSSLLFSSATPEQLLKISTLLEEKTYKKGEPIILENEVRDHVYFVKSGQVEIVSYISSEKQMHRIAILEPGENFSEFSVLNQGARTSSAYALEDCSLLRISGQNFLKVLNHYPNIAHSLAVNLASMTAEVYDTQTFIEYYRRELVSVDPQILNIFPVPLWQKYKAIPISYEAGVLTVAVQNPKNEALFKSLQTQAPKIRVNIFLISESDFKKERQVLAKQYASQKTSTKQKKKPAEELSISDLLNLNPLFSGLPKSIIEQITPHFQKREYKTGEVIFEAGSVSTHLYLIGQGRVLVSRPLNDSHIGMHVAAINDYEYFGDISLLCKHKYQHSAIATENCVIYSLDKNVFDQLVKVPQFSISLSKKLASIIENLNHLSGLEYFETEEELDLTDLADILPFDIIKKSKVIPLGLDEDELTLGIVNPESQEIFATVARHLGDYRINFVIISLDNFHKWCMQLSHNLSQTASVVSRPKNVDATDTLNAILQEAFSNRASDIHIEAHPEHYLIRYRVDGVLRERKGQLPIDLGKQIVGRIKVLSDLDIVNDRTPQDGQLKHEVGEARFLARVSTLPAKYGEKVVLRVIHGKSKVEPLDVIAPDKRVVNILQNVAHTKQGLFLVTGPTGSGKSTTLYSLLDEINQIGINVITLEDPVEKEIPGITQVQVNNKKGLNFHAALRSFLRQDPDVIMVGEIRDEESAKIVFEAAITGHLVLSTMHTNTSLDVMPRLKELGISPVTMATALLGSVSQRLVRANCKQCVRERPTTDYEKELFKKFLPQKNVPFSVKEGRGCGACNGTGYFGRVPVFEIWQNTQAAKQVILHEEKWTELESAVRKDGFVTLFEFGLQLVLSGLISMAEFKRCLGS